MGGGRSEERRRERSIAVSSLSPSLLSFRLLFQRSFSPPSLYGFDSLSLWFGYARAYVFPPLFFLLRTRSKVPPLFPHVKRFVYTEGNAPRANVIVANFVSPLSSSSSSSLRVITERDRGRANILEYSFASVWSRLFFEFRIENFRFF